MKALHKTALALALASALPAMAQIRTDASLGQAAQSLTGPNYLIGQGLGKLSGTNLFHSFQTFNVATGESATFTTSTPGITNVISRVTGGEASWINGQVSLNAASGKPAFFFINPAGVVFGAGASIDVPGAFHVSTADSLRFADGSRLQVDLSKVSSFSSAAPEAFGFLGAQSKPVVVYDGAVLATNAGQSMSLTGGDLLVDNGILAGSADIRLAAVGKQALDLPLVGTLPALSGQIILRNEALIGSSNLGSQDAGRVSLDAGSITLTGLSSISSYARAGTSGKGASISLRAASNVLISDGANLYSTAAGAGDAGDISVEGNGLRLDLGGYIEGGSLAGSTGRGGAVQLLARQGLTLDSEASVYYVLRGGGSGGLVSLSGASIGLSDLAYVSVSALGSGNTGELRLQSTGGISLDGGAQVLAYSQSGGLNGAVKLHAGGGLAMAGGSTIRNIASANGTKVGGIELSLGGDLTLNGHSHISVGSQAGGAAGNVVAAARHMTLDGGSFITNGALDSLGSAGNISLNATGTVTLSNDAYLSTSTDSDQHGGSILLRAQSLLLSNGGSIGSNALGGSGNAGSIDIAAAQRVELTGASAIGSGTLTSGNGGLVRVAAPIVSLGGKSTIYTTAALGSLGNAGQIEISAPTRLSLSAGSLIDSSSLSLVGNAGSISISAGSVDFVGSSMSSRSLTVGSRGQGGSISMQATGKVSLSQDSVISTSTSSRANAGAISLSAADLLLDHSSLLSLARAEASGSGGNIDVTLTGEMRSMVGIIGTTTFGAGAGGAVQLRAHDIIFDGPLSSISAAAAAGSSGQVGSIDVRASGKLSLLNGASLSISNLAVSTHPATLQPSVLSVTAKELEMRDADISAASFGNVAASRIAITTSDSTKLLRSAIETTANEGNGGPISLQAGRLLVLDNSLLTTSVFGSQGNGGNIALTSELMLMKTGFVQANTSAALASGGLVAIDVRSLVASGNSLFVGGQVPLAFKPGVFGLNVIQAAAPTGVSGVIAITSPVLDLSGSLSVLEARPIDTGGLGRNPCQTREGSSLSQSGRGGLPASARGLLGSDGLAASDALAAPRAVAMLGVAAGGCR